MKTFAIVALVIGVVLICLVVWCCLRAAALAEERAARLSRKETPRAETREK